MSNGNNNDSAVKTLPLKSEWFTAREQFQRLCEENKQPRVRVDCATAAAAAAAVDDGRGTYKLVTTVGVRRGDILLIERARAYHPIIVLTYNSPLAEFLYGDIGAMPDKESQLHMELLESVMAEHNNKQKRARRFLISYLLPVEQPYARNMHMDKLAYNVTKRAILPLIFGATQNIYATGFFDTASRCNHSCEPNAAIAGHGRTLIMYALEDMTAGTEVTISYNLIVGLMPFDVDVRRGLLAKRLEPKHCCLCSACTAQANAPSPPACPNEIRAALHIMAINLNDQMMRFRRDEEFTNAWIEAAKSIINFLDKAHTENFWNVTGSVFKKTMCALYTIVLSMLATFSSAPYSQVWCKLYEAAKKLLKTKPIMLNPTQEAQLVYVAAVARAHAFLRGYGVDAEPTPVSPLSLLLASQIFTFCNGTYNKVSEALEHVTLLPRNE